MLSSFYSVSDEIWVESIRAAQNHACITSFKSQYTEHYPNKVLETTYSITSSCEHGTVEEQGSLFEELYYERITQIILSLTHAMTPRSAG